MASFMFATLASAVEIAGVKVADQLKLGETTLELNGAGVRSKWFFDLYVGSLYLPEKTEDASAILAKDEIQIIQLAIISDMITSEKMQAATREGFDNSLGGNTEPLQTEIDQFLTFFAEPIQDGDKFVIAYFPGTGIDVMKNNKTVGSIASGVDFKQAVFGIWLSSKPAQKDLKKSMLGK